MYTPCCWHKGSLVVSVLSADSFMRNPHPINCNGNSTKRRTGRGTDACTPTPGCQCVTTAKHTNSTSNQNLQSLASPTNGDAVTAYHDQECRACGCDYSHSARTSLAHKPNPVSAGAVNKNRGIRCVSVYISGEDSAGTMEWKTYFLFSST